MNATNATSLATSCQAETAWGVELGLALGVAASIGINIGQNMQADGMAELPEEFRVKAPHKSRKWVVGMAVFVSFSMVNFVALAFAPPPPSSGTSGFSDSASPVERAYFCYRFLIKIDISGPGRLLG